jgi:plastocyanin
VNIIGRGSFLLGIVLLSAAIGLAVTGVRMSGEASAVNAVSMGDNFFEPLAMTVPAGTTIQWRNDGSLPHTATSDAGAARTFDSGILRTGGTYSLAFDTPGSFAYRCELHPEMVGAIVVQAAAVPTPPAGDTQDPPAANTIQAGGDGASQTGDTAGTQSGQALGETAPASGAAGALPVGGGAPPIAGDMMSSALLLAISGGVLIVLGLSTMGLAARRSA